MITLNGKYNFANVMIDEIDDTTREQIISFLNHPVFQKTYISIMSDTHAGAGAVIGFTAKLNDYVIPNVVGVDIGCGVLAVKLNVPKIDFSAFDTYVKENIPAGFKHHQKPHYLFTNASDISDVCSLIKEDYSKVWCQLGTLGGGNHFIEIDKHDDNYWLIVHTGSRNFGLKVASYYQSKARELCQKMLVDVPKGLEYLPLDLGGKEYLRDMRICQEFARTNRESITEKLLGFFRCEYSDRIESVHNYIGEDNIIRKGAVSAKENERLIIPFNMRDGVAICTGKGNKKWNYSAPHGAGRIMSRNQAFKELTNEQFNQDMNGIYTTTANDNTLDESPRAYKCKEVIIEATKETVDIDLFMKPVYNFKASE
jgi:RNA-splicing ligase RtcB